MCKEPECDRAVVAASRKEPIRLWAFLVQIALCTLWGRKARSRAYFQRVCLVRGEAQDERDRELDELRGRLATHGGRAGGQRRLWHGPGTMAAGGQLTGGVPLELHRGGVPCR